MLDYKGVIFDMDGTLIDSMKLWADIDVEFLSKRGFEVPDDYISSIAHLGAMDTALYTIERFNLADTPESLINEWENLAQLKYKSVPEKDGIEEYLTYLKSNGIKTAIATATRKKLVKAAMEGRKIYSMIDSVTTVDEVKRGKGFPDIYLKASEKLGLNSKDCIVFEDIVLGVKGAKDGGFKTVAVYDDCSKNAKEKLQKLADRYIYSFTEMIPK